MDIPARTDAQKKKARARCNRICPIFKKYQVIIDDESYFTLSHSSINGNRNFYTSDISATPANVKYRPKAKYEQKLLVWVCFSAKGI